MKVTVTRFSEQNTSTNLDAYVDVVVNGTLALNGLMIKNAVGQNGEPYQFVASPSYKTKNGEYRDWVTGISHDFSKAVVDAYKAAVESPERKASVGEYNRETAGHWLIPHVTPYQNDAVPNRRGLATLQVKEADSEKQMFSINGIQINESKGNYFINFPTRAYTKENGETVYPAIAKSFTYKDKDGKEVDFVKNLIWHEAKEAGVITPKGLSSLEQNAKDAADDQQNREQQQPEYEQPGLVI